MISVISMLEQSKQSLASGQIGHKRKADLTTVVGMLCLGGNSKLNERIHEMGLEHYVPRSTWCQHFDVR